MLAGERIVTVASMSPGDAFELFCQRATAVDESVVVTESDRPTVESICRRLDGIPLAIELAAGRVRTSTLTDILERLDDRFRLLRGGPADGPQRQQTLRATVAWSHDLLDDGASTVFERASVFAGGFDAEAARAVLGHGRIDEADVVSTLDDLVQKSMVVADRRGDRVRYSLAETLRQFGADQLDRRGEGSEVRRRHVEHFLRVARRADQLWVSPRQAEASAIFGREWDNLRAAQHWATGDDPDSAASLVAATGAYAYSSRDDEHGDWATVALRRLPADCPARSSLLGWSAVRRYFAHDWDQTLALAVSGIDACTTATNPARSCVAAWRSLPCARAATSKGRAPWRLH